MELFTLKVLPDKMQAFLIIQPPAGDSNVSKENADAFLKLSGIKFGIDDNAITDAIKQKKWGEEIQVAAGQASEKGTDGAIKYMFDTNPKGRPTERKDGRLDFFDLHTSQCVKSGEILAELVPPSEGKPGTNVLGATLPSAKGKPARIQRGKNTDYKDETKSALVAKIDGNVKLVSGGAVEVSQSMAISGDINLGTGNIEIVGDLVVKGDVKAGFRVSATGNIEIGGTVEDAHVNAGGTVVIKGGFLGEGNGQIVAGRDVLIKYIYRQTIKAGGDIEIMEECTQANLSAEGVIRICKGKGILIGGVALAGKAVEVKIVGNAQNTPAEITVGGRADLLKRTEGLHRNAAFYDEKLNEVADQMSKLMTKKKKTGLVTKDEEKFRILDKLSADIERSIQATRAELSGCEKELEELRKTAYIDVYKIVYPGVTMKIAGYTKFIEKEREKTRFKISGTEIIGIEDQ